MGERMLLVKGNFIFKGGMTGRGGCVVLFFRFLGGFRGCEGGVYLRLIPPLRYSLRVQFLGKDLIYST